MVRPSNPLLMSIVLDAVGRLSERKGSTVRDILDFVQKNSNGFSRNLTMQVHRALKHAVNAGLLRHRSGRYKVLLSINPISAQQSVAEDSKSIDGFTDKLLNGSPERSTKRNKNFDRKQGGKQTRRKGAASRSGECTHNRKCSESLEKARLTRRQKRKAGGRIEENDDWVISGRRKQFAKRQISEIVQEDLSPLSDHSHEKIIDFDSDVSNENYDKSTNSKNRFYSRDEERLSSPRRKRSPVRQEHRGQSSKTRTRKRSSSRNRSPQRSNYNQNQNQQEQQQQQLEIEEIPNENLENTRMDCEQVSGNIELIDDSPNPEIERDCKPNNSGSGSSL
ncbi:uncharacterized protein LOC118450476 [Vespa mandarinia]|uniref:uncharacterized protein LOC118450476 n=1 Tax=Vespa mandarinia TaxID=7446 RepID=UPI00160B0675|nr:uncharacterized protein LOC118450476 [Vespa mandarinia]XP_035742172.1 uncharacterized protein LOC118450476 [Vespa mandarinia]XP_035742173.1 uncharacterized protein LOC118450476 [Vespa mandarinia]XP_035742174.1 uncharacterized protein LOC118450476 [Vespa mandarinia]XP_035742175.1 uncharacterized protein LOC118450476 [Vespa mandarinia]XP_035742176.1 uncharacterized protein LOC118450476 [Vespa mandarinia]XP_035742177.1 uncharacterized protein LOC118450476 [Vespa mandarinia]